MKPPLSRLCLLCAALFSPYAGAVGFGEIILHSRIGEPLNAEVPIIGGDRETLATACFSLGAIHNADLPVISAARTRIVGDGDQLKILITSRQGIAEPIFMIGLRANCGVELQRDYTLMPAPPESLAEVSAPSAQTPAQNTTPPPVRRRIAANFQQWRAHTGDTLTSIAENKAAGDADYQQRLLGAIQRANPNLDPNQPLTEGTAIRIPKLRAAVPAASRSEQGAATSRPLAKPKADYRPATPRSTIAKPPQAPKLAAPEAATDRVVLGTAPDPAAIPGKALSTIEQLHEVEGRMLKMETTLHLLNQEVEKLNTALALATEAIAVQNKLQMAQTLPAANEPAAIKATAPTPSAPNTNNRNNWLELLFSALFGGVVAAGFAHLISRPKQRDIDDELPLVVAAGQHANPALDSAPPTSGAPNGEATPAAVDIPLDDEPGASAESGAVSVNFQDDNSALELAEIMLSFGRVRGAAETLAAHIEENSPDNIQPWSMLLDLYRRGGMQAEFAALATRIRQRFNVHVPSWNESTTPVSGLKSLEDYAHIIGRTTQEWGSQKCLDFLRNLVRDNRAGQRSGFPLEVVEEIALLMRVLEDAYGLKRSA